MVLSMVTMYLKYPLVLFGSEGSALNRPLFHLSPIIIMLYNCSSAMSKDLFLVICYSKDMASVCQWAFTHALIHRRGK